MVGEGGDWKSPVKTSATMRAYSEGKNGEIIRKELGDTMSCVPHVVSRGATETRPPGWGTCQPGGIYPCQSLPVLHVGVY